MHPALRLLLKLIAAALTLMEAAVWLFRFATRGTPETRINQVLKRSRFPLTINQIYGIGILGIPLLLLIILVLFPPA